MIVINNRLVCVVADSSIRLSRFGWNCCADVLSSYINSVRCWCGIHSSGKILSVCNIELDIVRRVARLKITQKPRRVLSEPPSPALQWSKKTVHNRCDRLRFLQQDQLTTGIVRCCFRCMRAWFRGGRCRRLIQHGQRPSACNRCTEQSTICVTRHVAKHSWHWLLRDYDWRYLSNTIHSIKPVNSRRWRLCALDVAEPYYATLLY